MRLALSILTGGLAVAAAPAANATAMMYCLQGQAYVVTCTGPNNADCWTSAAGGCAGSWAIELDLVAAEPNPPRTGSPRDPVRQTAGLLTEWRPEPGSWSRPPERFIASLRRQGVQGRLAVPVERLSPGAIEKLAPPKR